MAFWRQQLRRHAAGLATPDRSVASCKWRVTRALQRFELPRALAESLVKLAEQEGATVYMVALAVFKALLYR